MKRTRTRKKVPCQKKTSLVSVRFWRAVWLMVSLIKTSIRDTILKPRFCLFLFFVCFVFRSCLFGLAGFWVRRMKGGRIFVLMCICSFAFFSLFLLLQRSSKADSSQEHKRSFRVASYNLWNVNYHWKLRLSRLRDIIEEKDFDVIALQEVRGNSTHSPMMVELARLLPQYPYAVYQPALHKPARGGQIEGEFEYEGVGLISKYNFETLEHVNLTRGAGTDLNVRVVLFASVTPPAIGETIGVYAVHWSYDKQQQCLNSLETVEYVNRPELSHDLHPENDEFSETPTPEEQQEKFKLRPPTALDVILGDFNIYNDFQSSIEHFEKGSVEVSGNCSKFLKNPPGSPIQRGARNFPRNALGGKNVNAPVEQKGGISSTSSSSTPWYLEPKYILNRPFTDSWKERYPEKAGYTFSTLVKQGLHVRPDRLLYRSLTGGVRLTDVEIMENGETFSIKYLWPIAKIRFERMLSFSSTVHEFLLKKKYHSQDPCGQECGDNATCHCGICAYVELDEKGRKMKENLPHCPHFQVGVFGILALFAVSLISTFCASILLFVGYYSSGNSNTKKEKPPISSCSQPISSCCRPISSCCRLISSCCWKISSCCRPISSCCRRFDRLGSSSGFRKGILICSTVVLLLVWLVLIGVILWSLLPFLNSLYELSAVRIGPDELRTSDHLLVFAEFIFS